MKTVAALRRVDTASGGVGDGSSRSRAASRGSQNKNDKVQIKSLKLTLLLGAVFAAMKLAAIAGPGPQQVYKPLNSKEEVSALKPGSIRP